MKKYRGLRSIPGGLSQGMSLQDIAKKHNAPLKHMIHQLQMGTDVEMEHTTSKKIAKEIAMDHLVEDPFYYDKLAFMEHASW